MFPSFIAFLVAWQVYGEPLLVERSHPIAKTQGWAQKKYGGADYLWWTPNQILIFYPGGKERLMDIRTKKLTPIYAPALLWGERRLSPDRRKVILEERAGSALQWQVRDLTGRKEFASWTIPKHPSVRNTVNGPVSVQLDSFFESELDYARGAMWSTDGKSIYLIDAWDEEPAEPASDIRQGSSGGFGGFRSGSGIPSGLFGNRIVKVQVQSRSWANPKSIYQFPVLTGPAGTYIQSIHSRKAQTDNGMWIRYGIDELGEWDLDRPSKDLSMWKVPSSDRHCIDSYQPSPNFQRALWLTKGQFGTASLWVSGLHGENMKELGIVPVAPEDLQRNLVEHFTPRAVSAEDPDYLYGYRLCNVQWNPDNKHISFELDGVIYLVGT